MVESLFSVRGQMALVLGAFGLGLKYAAADAIPVARRPRTKPIWERDATGTFVVITAAADNELVGDVLRRYGISAKTLPEEPDYVAKIKKGRRHQLVSEYWDRHGGDYDPPPGIPCLRLEYGIWDADSRSWTATMSSISSSILKGRVPPGLAMRIVQVGFDYGQVATLGWTIEQRIRDHIKVRLAQAADQIRWV